MIEEDFELRLVRMKSRGTKPGKRYAHQVLATINRAGGRHA